MSHLRHVAIAALAVLPLLGPPALAEPVAVVTDIAPVAALVAAVQDGRGTVAATVDAAADAHHVTLRPSQARRLSEADLAVWIGPGLSPWFETALTRLATATPEIRLLDAAPILFNRRDDDNHGQGEDNGHGNSHAHDDDHEHEGDHDPHAWLAAENAVAWLDRIAKGLATLDPDHAEAYRSNAAATAEQVAALAEEIATRSASRDAFTYLAAHDSFQYAEGLMRAQFAGAVSDSHAVRPGPAHLAEIEDSLAQGDMDCLLAAPADADRLLERLSADHDVPLVIADIQGAEVSADGFVRWFSDVYDEFGRCVRAR